MTYPPSSEAVNVVALSDFRRFLLFRQSPNTVRDQNNYSFIFFDNSLIDNSIEHTP